MRMKNFMLLLSVISLLAFVNSCKKGADTAEDKTTYFLSDIRSKYFGNLDFESEIVRQKIVSFREDIYTYFGSLEQQYRTQAFTTTADRENYRLSSQYFSFYTFALTLAYLDSTIAFSDIQGNKPVGLFSKLPSSTPDFEFKEMSAMMAKGTGIAKEAVSLDGRYDDKTQGFYLGCLQAEMRLKNKNDLNNPEAHKLLTDYTYTRLTNYNFSPVWNVLMAQVTYTNYNDWLNTFDNQGMVQLHEIALLRLAPGVLPDLGGLGVEIVAPLYRFDLSMKRIDWYLKKPSLTQSEQDTVKGFITGMEVVTNYIETQRKHILDTWSAKNSYTRRKEKLNAIRSYFDNYNPAAPKPELASFINSKDFKRAYQCYACHRSSGL
jgi:hypothetical protein